MSEIVAGLIGVVAGGLVTGAVGVVQAHQDRSLKRRVAARLIAADLAKVAVFVDRVIEAGEWPDEPISLEGPRETWLAQREAFAVAVTANDWIDIASVYDRLSEIEAAVRPGEALSDEDGDLLVELANRLTDALQLAMERSMPRREYLRMHRTVTKDGA